MKISDILSNIQTRKDNLRGGLELVFDLGESKKIQLSGSWRVAGWMIRYVFLPPHQTLELEDETHYLKVIFGELSNLGRGCFAEDYTVRTTRLENSSLLAGSQGLLFALLTETPDLKSNIYDMSECVFSGPMAEKLTWKSFKQRFGAWTSYFDELDNHMADGFHLLDKERTDITYVNFWTCGKSADVSTHNHAQEPSLESPAFAEVHLVLNNGSEFSGMYKIRKPEDDPTMRKMYFMKRGDEHGPFFEHHSGRALFHDNGAVKYPWHGWQNGSDDSDESTYDLVAAFEINPEYAQMPLKNSSEEELI
jgi:hypothetical protein